MIRARRFLGLLASAVALLSQLQVWNDNVCSMCGASCRCASHASSDSCRLRAVGCGGATGDVATGSGTPLRAVLAAASVVAPPRALGFARPAEAALPPQPVHDPLDRPPRVSC